MKDITDPKLDEARHAAWSEPLDGLNVAVRERFVDNTMWPYFDRLRAESPVHWCDTGDFVPHWSITRYKDIVAVDSDFETFSSAEGISLQTPESLDFIRNRRPAKNSFIAMDPPEHDVQRKAVSPAVAPTNLRNMEPILRERAQKLLDDLPIGEKFDWVDRVSKEFTAMTLATLFDFPFEDRRMLTYWSDIFTNVPGHGPVTSWDQKLEETTKCFDAFAELWNQRVNAEPGIDLVSMLAHNPMTRNMDRQTFNGNLGLLIIGGNDTTRNTLSGSVYALNKFPGEYDKLRANPSLIPSMVSETIRWQTPLAHMARTATRDVEMHGKTIRKGDWVVMWYISGNRDDDQIERPNDYWIDRPKVRNHLSFGFGIHRCVGNRLAELQLTILWEEILKRFPTIELLEEPERTYSCFIKGYETLPVIIPERL
ncbi:cytochrome P450 [Oceanicola sp. 22II-s10i]|uniref:cytochrome P450 n=1 Tax=Oceanicola sp. 22II-s10i TaxID=1317116 RepID=UPI000B523A52|nr:cytochrome P450 [Oceanicola sp. 22II-s10i]OWU84454.1 cytochrome P450 [Oceanicola sp. 22II-s10i]